MAHVGYSGTEGVCVGLGWGVWVGGGVGIIGSDTL